MLKRLTTLMSLGCLLVTVACAQTDAGITTSVKSQLAADESVKAYQIDVDTQEGRVTLTGSVDDPLARERALSIARGTDGVSDVVDRLTVAAVPRSTTGELRDDADDAVGSARDAAGRAGEALSDASITAAVKTKVLADTVAPGLRIDVTTRDAVVTLSGTVANKAEAERAASLARDTDGVKSVVNNLKVN